MVDWRCKNLAVISIFLIFLSGCVSSYKISKEEIIEYSDPKYNSYNYSHNLTYADNLSDIYMEYSGKASRRQDIIALTTIGFAAAAAGGFLYDAKNLNFLKGVGLAAGTTSAVSNYFKPGEFSSHLLNAAQQLACIVKKGRTHETFFYSIIKIELIKYQEATGIVRDGIRSVRVNLRKTLNRGLPDYSQLVKDLTASATTQKKTEVAILKKSGEPIQNVAWHIDTLRTEVDECKLIIL